MAICEAIASIEWESTEEDADNAVAKIRAAGRPDSEVLRDVQDHIDSTGNQLMLFIARFEDLNSACEAVGITTKLPVDPPSSEQ